jgi:hypothetical protein
MLDSSRIRKMEHHKNNYVYVTICNVLPLTNKYNEVQPTYQTQDINTHI